MQWLGIFQNSPYNFCHMINTTLNSMKHANLKFIVVLLILSHSLNVQCQSVSNPLNQTAGEDDWSLPASVVKSSNAGLFDVPGIPDALSGVVTWRMLNPSENVYNWDLFDNAFAQNKPFFLRIWASDTLHCPIWLKTKYPNLPILHYGDVGVPYFDFFQNIVSPANFYAMWHPDFVAEFKKFLLAFKAKNYLANPNLKFMYAPGAWRWNEWEVGPILDEMQTKTPMTPASFLSWFKQHIDDYVDASNGYAYKMVFTGYGRIEKPYFFRNHADWFLPLNDTAQGDNILTSYAVSKGMSVREGAQEYFNTTSYAYSWGSSFTTIQNKNYQTIDENHPLHKDSLRIIGTENEGFCDPAMLAVCSYYHIKMSTIKALQLRVNWLNSRDNLVALDPKLFEYARKTMGKNIKNSPDAWVALRESFDHLLSATPPVPKPNMPAWTDRVSLPFRNWEKWLMQREVTPDGKTVPVYQLISNAEFDINNLKAYEALRTDRANGSNYIYFDVDDNFMKGGVNGVRIKITYLDNFSGKWCLEYDAANNGSATKKSNEIINANSNTWKTVSINIADAGFTNRQNGNMDFRIYNGGSSNITVRFVRLIKDSIAAITTIDDKSNCDDKIKIYLNSGNSILKIDSKVQLEEITVNDIKGRLKLKANKNIDSINLSRFANGVYLIRFKTKNSKIICTKKFIKI